MDKGEYLQAPFVPWEVYPTRRDTTFLPTLTPDGSLPISKVNAPEDIDDPHLILRCANRVILRELMMLKKASVVVEWDDGTPNFWIHLKIDDKSIGPWEEGCRYREPWGWWSEFKYGKGKRVFADDPEIHEHTLTVSRPTDPMSYALTAWKSANTIADAIESQRTPNAFGAIDVIACLMAAHPATPDSILRRLAADPQPVVRGLVATNPSASPETAALVALG